MTAAPRVAVVGGGIVGLCAALSLREGGAEVTVFEREIGGENASFGNGGVVSPACVTPYAMPGLWRSLPRWLLDPLGPVHLRPRHLLRGLPWAARFLAHGREATARRVSDAMHALNHDCVVLYRRHLAGTGHEALLRDGPYLFATRDRRKARLDTLDARLKQAHGAWMERIDGAALRALEPALSPDYEAGLIVHGQARALSPGRIGAALRDKLRAMGGAMAEAEIRALAPEVAGGWRLEAAGGARVFDRVALTAGVWSAKLLAPLGLSPPLESERGYHVRFRDPDVALENAVMDMDRLTVASSMEEGLRVAGTVDLGGIDSEPLPARARAVAEAARRMLPDLRSEPAESWSGQRPSFPDGLPAIGPAPGLPGLFLGFGHAHWGFMMAPKTGDLLAAAILGRPSNIDLAPYRIDRFRSIRRQPPATLFRVASPPTPHKPVEPLSRGEGIAQGRRSAAEKR